MVVHFPIKLGILTTTSKRKSGSFVYQQGNTMYSTYAAGLVYLPMFHPLS